MAGMTAQEINKGRMHLYYGDGKGKTTAAIGLAIRAAGAGKSVVFAQFMKNMETSELHVLGTVPNITIVRMKDKLGWYKNADEDTKQRFCDQHNAILDQIEALMTAGQCDVLILDEITYPVNYQIIDVERLRRIIEGRNEHIEVVCTGRNPDGFFVERADYITEMKMHKHPFVSLGLPAREGIEF